ncbi:HET-domain-containing protein [Apiospora rasikravindrae]|uniref:HET-domain-containing protein n=1 Tax=Apiospora rasikravindrae TaxID=990691 RepID=A0ABR1U284_9PEZI
MICPSCKNSIFESARSWGYHQFPASQESLPLEAEDCILCDLLKGEIKSWLGSDSSTASKNGFYRWTIHRSPRFRESETSCSIHFRPDVSQYPQLGNAPTKVFHLISADSVDVNLDLGKELDAEAVGPQLETWLETCRTTHRGRCAVPDSPAWVPKRLVDLATLADGRVVVRETRSLSSPKPRFVTLSHCWGGPTGPRMIQLVPETLAEFTDPGRGIAIEQLPRNFRDAVLIARRLKTQYIWIDSLCILQDGEEFKTEGQLMHLVYRNSYCNLAAAASGDCQGGLFRTRQKVESFGGDMIETSEQSLFGKGTWRVFPSECWSDQLLMQPLYRRGWVFQERMLSPRILHFAQGQVFWDCASATACEVLPEGLPWQLDAASSTEKYWRERLQLVQNQGQGGADSASPSRKFVGSADVSFESFWKEAVLNYTSCNLTQNRDRLLAIWGVAKLVRDQFRLDNWEEDYGVGLWSSQLSEQLAWKVQDPSRARRPPELSGLWPSWSWASVVGSIETQLRSSEPGQFYSATSHDGGVVGFELADLPRGADADDSPKTLQTKFLALRSVFVHVAVEGQMIITHEAAKEKPHQEDTHIYTLRLIDQVGHEGAQCTGLFKVSPDATSEFSQVSSGDCYLVILTASRDQEQVLEDSGWSSDEDDEPIKPVWIHGTGLVVVRTALDKEEGNQNDRQYRRIGVCNFEGLSSEDFTRLEQSSVSDIWLV